MKQASGPGELGGLLKHWRGLRGRSQLDISVDSGISQRQISFIESGRSVPTRSTLMGIAQVLDVPLRERNALLLAAGYAPLYAETAWNSDQMQSISRALQRMLLQHEPYPAFVLDRYWNVLQTNEAAPRFFGAFVDLSRWPTPRNLLRLVFDPLGLRSCLAQWDVLARSLLQRVRREAVGRVLDAGTQQLLADLLAYPDVPSDWQATERDGALPMVPMRFIKDGATLNYFSLVTSVGTPQTIAAQELRVECLFPADEATEAHHARCWPAAAR